MSLFRDGVCYAIFVSLLVMADAVLLKISLDIEIVRYFYTCVSVFLNLDLWNSIYCSVPKICIIILIQHVILFSLCVLKYEISYSKKISLEINIDDVIDLQ